MNTAAITVNISQALNLLSIAEILSPIFWVMSFLYKFNKYETCINFYAEENDNKSFGSCKQFK